MKKIFEGLREGDLYKVVLPLISIDEYESKIDEDNIVVAFFSDDRDPANDLSRFIEKSEFDILDTEVSPVPNEEGYFVIFVEFFRDDKFVQTLDGILNALVTLVRVDVNEWEVKLYKRNDLFNYDANVLNKLVRLETNKKQTKV